MIKAPAVPNLLLEGLDFLTALGAILDGLGTMKQEKTWKRAEPTRTLRDFCLIGYRRLHLPVNARAQNMFSRDVKLLSFRRQTLKFSRPREQSEPREHRLYRLYRGNFTFGRENFKV